MQYISYNTASRDSPDIYALALHHAYISGKSLLAVYQDSGSESRGQGGSSKRRPDGLETHTCEYFTGTRVVKFENVITEEP